MDTDPAVIQQGTVGQNGKDVVLYDLAVIDELAGRRTSQARLLNMKAPGSDGSSDEKITGEMSPRSDLGRFAGGCLHVEEYHSWQRRQGLPGGLLSSCGSACRHRLD